MAETDLSKIDTDVELTVIEPSRGWRQLNLKELWRYRELVFFLIWRDVKVRYKQTFLGAAWAIIQPFMTMVVFSIFFGSLAKIPTDGIPYPIFSYTALLPWQLFETGISKSGKSLVSGRTLLTKVYFPRLAIPLAPVVAALVDFVLAFVVLIAMMIYYGYTPTRAIWTLPLFLLLAMVTALGAGFWLSAMNVWYRDIGYIIPFFSRLWFYLTPITYAASIVPEQFQILYALNPMVGVVEGFRWAMLGLGDPPSAEILISVLISIVMMVTGAFYFRRMERTFADVV